MSKTGGIWVTATNPQTRTRDWVSIREACALLGVSAATLRRWSDAGDIRVFTTPGGHRRFSRDAVMALLPAARRVRPTMARLGETTEQISRVYRRQFARPGDAPAWIEGLDETERGPFRERGRQIAAALLGSFDAATPAEREETLAAAEAVAAEYGRIAARRRVSVRETVELFLRFRLPFMRELGAVARRRGLDTTETTELLESATDAFDRLLRATLREYDAVICPRLQATEP